MVNDAEHYHAVIWLDHHEARIIHFNAEVSDEVTMHPAHPPRHLHIKAGSPSGTHVTFEPEFYRDIARTCDAAKAVLLAGPSTAKAEFIEYLHRHSPQTFKCIAGVETLAWVTDNQLLAEGRRYFTMANRASSPHS